MRLNLFTYLLLTIFLMNFQGSYAQTTKLSGYVKDSLNNPLSYANIIAQPKDVSKNLQFAITDNEGYYQLVFAKGDTVTISISYLGYKPVEFEFITNQSTQKDFIMQTSSEQLEEVVIEMPITVKGDTTTYRTDKFATGEERKLKNVLKKLPGVEVDKNGKVTVQGKKVTKMFVEGKKFFGGGTKLAVENIPADAVDKVQVIDNYNEVTFLKNLTDSDELVMNIQLKEDKKRFVFGDVEADKGIKGFYKTHANLFYYSPKTNVNFISNLNNIAEKTFTFKDYLNFQGGVNAVFSGSFNWGGGDFSQFLENRDVLKSNQQFGAINVTKVTSDKLDVSGFLIFSRSDTKNYLETQNDYSTFTEFRESIRLADNLLGIGKLNIEYAVNSKEQFYARTQVKRTDNASNNSILSLIEGDTDIITTNSGLEATSLNQSIEWHKRQSNTHTFSTIVNYDYRKNNQDVLWQTDNAILQGLIPIVLNQEVLRLHQTRNTKSHTLNGIFKHFWEINHSNHIYTTLGDRYLKEHFFTDDRQELDDGSINDFSSGNYGNDLDFMLNDLFFGVHYKFKTGIFTVKQGVYLHNYSWKVNQQNEINQNKWVLLPDFLAKIEFNKSKKIQFNYSLKTSFSDASKFANRFYLQSYNSVFRGNENLENDLFHSARIYYSRFSLYRGLIMNAGVNYSKQIKGVRNTVEFNEVNQFLTNRLFNNPSESINARVSIHKKIKKIRYKLDITASSLKYLQEIDNVIEDNINKNYSYKLGFETLYENFPNIEAGFKRSIGSFTSSNNTSKFRTNEPYLSVNYDFLKGFIVSFDYTSYDFKNKVLNQENRFDVANFTLSYQKENSAWTYKIFSNNLFNTSFKRNSSFSQYLISDTKTFILPRVLMFGVSYNL
ncbi:MAG: carboxypeptidase-like regulatory domain-containing protein [Flavobacteriaceae bacterium]